MEHLNSQFGALASAATNSNAALEQLATTTTNQYVEIKASLNRLTAATPTGAVAPTPAYNSTDLPRTEKQTYDKQIRLLQSSIRNKWVLKTIFCSTHRWGIGPGHTSAECKGKKDDGKPVGHVDAETRDNPVGLGKSINKGWDYFSVKWRSGR